MNLISLSDEYKIRIQEIYKSEEKVSFLIGCKGSNRTLKELFNNEERHLLRELADEWLEEILNVEINDD